MTTIAISPHARHRARTTTLSLPPGRPSPAVAAQLAEAATRAQRETSITQAVRSAWDAIACSPDALTAWATALGHDGPAEGLFPAACLASATPTAAAASLYRAARGAGA